MDIKRGDTVYYRGEVWEVRGEWTAPGEEQHLFIFRVDVNKVPRWTGVSADQVQRVEQVR